MMEHTWGGNSHGLHYGITPAFAWSDIGKPLKLPVRIVVVRGVTSGIQSRKANHAMSDKLFKGEGDPYAGTVLQFVTTELI
jgi:hypothetical protein